MNTQITSSSSAPAGAGVSSHAHSRRWTTVDMVFTALMAAMMAVCAWITIPGDIPFTLQIFGLYVVLGLLGGRRGTMAIVVYILLGAVGLPVFSGFTGGIGRLLGTTGGYLIGYIFAGLLYWRITHLFGEKLPVQIVAMLLSLCLCYVFGTVWYVIVYARQAAPIGFVAALWRCVIPFIIPDLVKIGMAVAVTKMLGRYVPADSQAARKNA